ncbi:MAG: Phosphotransferase enzyme family protein [bacterium ADurb.Bin400]|nr:MAG: Phosphotransferase enzyme family protein [bacterium ADurb.Bin400]
MLIKGIEDKIDAIFHDHKLVPDKSPHDFLAAARMQGDKMYSTKCRNNNNQELFFKILIAHDDGYLATLKNEIIFSELFTRRTFHQFSTPIITESEKEPYCWYLRELIPGDVVGDFESLGANSASRISFCTRKALSALREMSRVRLGDAADAGIEIPSLDFYLDQIAENEEWTKPYFPNFQQEVVELFERHRSSLLDYLVMAHGDYHWGNLVFAKEQLYIIDWAHIHWGNIAEDFVKIWLSLWQYPQLQKKAYESLMFIT